MDSNDILRKINHDGGMTVPDGYFADFKRRMEASLPPTEFESGDEPKVLRGWWQRCRPYVYMAAMFAGVWCMMKALDLAHPSADLSVESHPTIAAAINNDEFLNSYIIPSVDESSLYDDLYNEGFDTEDFSQE